MGALPIYVKVAAQQRASTHGDSVPIELRFGGCETFHERPNFLFHVVPKEHDPLTFQLTYDSETNSQVIPDIWKPFLLKRLVDLGDFVAGQVLFPRDEDMVMVSSDEAMNIWVFSLVKIAADQWEGELVYHCWPDAIDMTYVLRGIEAEELDTILSALLEQLRGFLPRICSQKTLGQLARRLVLKVLPGELWFLRFPINLFVRRQDAGFVAYNEVEWIITNRGFTENSLVRKRVQRELSDPSFVLKHSVVILNTYLEHADNMEYCRGTGLAVEVLKYFKNVNLNGMELSLNWCVNPTANNVARFLSDSRIGYIIADFESRSGQWQLGQDFDTAKVEPRFFHFDAKNYNLSHVRLMRIFHCNSVFDPAREIFDNREPGDKHSIVGRLLNAGALRVEGGLTEENYFDFLCWLLRFFCMSNHLGFILKLKCVETGSDITDLMRRVEAFLEKHGWPSDATQLVNTTTGPL